MTTYVTYDTRTGVIVSVHYGATDEKQVLQRSRRRRKIDERYIDVIPVAQGSLEKGKRYKVDQGRKALLEAAAGDGLGFSFGETARLRSP
jgi:hypothetical protein